MNKLNKQIFLYNQIKEIICKSLTLIYLFQCYKNDTFRGSSTAVDMIADTAITVADRLTVLSVRW